MKQSIIFDNYMIYENGTVFNIKANKAVSPVYDKDGYCKIRLTVDGKRIKKSLHRIVALAFIENAENLPHINHVDGNKKNNKVENLEWCTPSQNNQHAYDTGLKRKNGEHYNARRVTCVSLDGNTKTFQCIKEALLEIGVSERTFYRSLNNGKYMYNGWKATYSD